MSSLIDAYPCANLSVVTYRSDFFQNLLNSLPDEQKWRLDAALIYGVVWVSELFAQDFQSEQCWLFKYFHFFFMYFQAEGATLLNAFNYIPSTVRTVLQFRSGAIPSLHDPTFIKYRLAGVFQILINVAFVEIVFCY